MLILKFQYYYNTLSKIFFLSRLPTILLLYYELLIKMLNPLPVRIGNLPILGLFFNC